MKKAVIFDLDGTLWNTVPQIVVAFNEVLARYPELNKQIDEAELRSYMGLNQVELAARMLPMVSFERQQELVEECFANEVGTLKVKPGVPYPYLKETLAQLSGEYFLAVVSNCQAGYIETFLDGLGVGEYISDHECFATGLPKGENIKLVMERNGIDRAVYLGDTQGDLNAADLADIPFIYAAYGFGSVDRETARINSLTELPELAAQLLK